MKKLFFIYCPIILITILLMAFSTGTARRSLIVREWMSDAYMQIRPTYYTYDEQGRIIRSEAQNPDTFVVTNTYTPTNIISIAHISTSPLYDTMIYTLNASGLIASDNHANTFTYDADGKRITGVDGEKYTWSNGDMMTRTYLDNNTPHIVRYTYTSIPDSRDYGDAAWGFRSAHLVETVDDPPLFITHKYLFDSEGRVITDSTGSNIYHYFY